jgi:hypothetical protein
MARKSNGYSDKRQRPASSLMYSDGPIDDSPAPVQTSIKSYATPLDAIHPDLEQPRKFAPVIIMAGWDGSPAGIPDLLKRARVEATQRLAYPLDPVKLIRQPEANGIRIDDDDVRQDTLARDPVVRWYLGIIRLAGSIADPDVGLINAITITKQEDDRLRVITGHRRLMAFWLLRTVFGEDYAAIPAQTIPVHNVWQQAEENNNRDDHNDIEDARTFALLMMDLYRAQGAEFLPYHEMLTPDGSDRPYYAQVADGNKWRVPRGEGERIARAMAAASTARLRHYRALLRIDDTLWRLADAYDWAEYFIRDAAALDDEWWQQHEDLPQAQLAARVEAAVKDMREADTVTAVTVSDAPQSDPTPAPDGDNPQYTHTFQRGDRVRNERDELGTITHPLGNDKRVGVIFDSMIPARRPPEELTLAPDEPPPPMGYRMKMKTGRIDDGAEHRGIMVAQKLINAGLWDNIGELWFNDVYAIHDTIMGSVSDLTVNDLILKRDASGLTVSLPQQRPTVTKLGWTVGDRCTVVSHGQGTITRVVAHNAVSVELDNGNVLSHVNEANLRDPAPTPDKDVSSASGSATDILRNRVRVGTVVTLTNGNRVKIVKRLFNGSTFKAVYADGNEVLIAVQDIAAIDHDQSWPEPPAQGDDTTEMTDDEFEAQSQPDDEPAVALTVADRAVVVRLHAFAVATKNRDMAHTLQQWLMGRVSDRTYGEDLEAFAALRFAVMDDLKNLNTLINLAHGHQDPDA